MTFRERTRQVRHVAVLGRSFMRGRGFGQQLPADLPPASTPPANALSTYFDGVSQGPGIWKWRHYFEAYDRHFNKFVGRPVTLVEVGVFSGGSIDMWRAYFGDGLHTYGIDIEPACKVYERPGVEIVIGDQSDPAFWQRFLAQLPGSLDIVIDDGGHEAHQQIATLEAVLPRLSPGGVYFCEDVHGEGHPFHAYMAGLQRNLHAVGQQRTDDSYGTTPFQAAINSVHAYPYVWVVEKRDGRLDELSAPKHGTSWQPFYEGVSFPE